MIGAVQGFSAWRRGLTATPAIASLHARGEEIRRAELERLEGQWEGLSEADRERLEALTKGIVSKLLHEPTVRIATAAEDGDALRHLESLRHLFGLEAPSGSEPCATPALAPGARADGARGRRGCARRGTRPSCCPSRPPATAGAPRSARRRPTGACSSRSWRRRCSTAAPTWPSTRPRTCPATSPRGSRSSRCRRGRTPATCSWAPPAASTRCPPGARVATGSPRRAAQLLAARPDLAVVPIRGNVGTRLDKLARGEADALVLAAAGLRRLGLWPEGADRAAGRRLHAGAGPGVPRRGGAGRTTPRRRPRPRRCTTRPRTPACGPSAPSCGRSAAAACGRSAPSARWTATSSR